jgi:hypothetical protein
MPSPERLPEDIRELVYRNGFELGDSTWESDAHEVARRLSLSKDFAAPAPAPHAAAVKCRQVGGSYVVQDSLASVDIRGDRYYCGGGFLPNGLPAKLRQWDFPTARADILLSIESVKDIRMLRPLLQRT